MVSYYENYGPYVDLVKNGTIQIFVPDININNYMDHFNGILNIMRDGIEDPEVQNLKINITLLDGLNVTFNLTDYFFQLIFFTFPIYMGDPVTALHLFDTRSITKKSLKQYFDLMIKTYYRKIDFIKLNNLIDETIYKFKYINEFAMYLGNTVNFRDTLDLMAKYPEFNDAMHADLSNIPIEDVKETGMQNMRIQVDYIKNNDHCLRDSFVAGEGINPKQYKEVASSIGTKPDGRGGIFPYVINRSFMTGGVLEPESYVIDSSVGRTAQILSKVNTGTSGSFARLLETNNLDTFFNENTHSDCNTKHYIEIFIKDNAWLKTYDRRYYKFRPDGPLYLLDADRDVHLIGQTLYFRSPMTCASYAHGMGLCSKCYGELININKDINPGKIAAEKLSSKYTQKLLSAKHLLEASMIEMKWTQEFYDIFDITLNTIALQEDIDFSGMYLVIDSNNIESNDDEDDTDTDAILSVEHITSFDIVYADGKRVTIHTADDDNIYISEDLNRVLRSKKAKEEDGVYWVALDYLKNVNPIFTVKIQNKELQRTLERAKSIIDLAKVTGSYTKDEIIREFIAANMEGNINIQAIHLEVIIANQMRNPDDILSMPNWDNYNCDYKILTLGSALTNSPSLTVSLEYQKISQTLVSPLTKRKHKASVFDLFFMENPQKYVPENEMISDRYTLIEDGAAKEELKDALIFDDPQYDTPIDPSELDSSYNDKD